VRKKNVWAENLNRKAAEVHGVINCKNEI